MLLFSKKYPHTHTHTKSKSSRIGSPNWTTSLQGRWQGEFLASSLERWDSGQGKISLPRWDIILMLIGQKALKKKCPLEQMEGGGAASLPARPCARYLCAHVLIQASPGLQVEWGWGEMVSTASSCELSTAGETEAQRGASTHTQVSVTPNPSSQPPRAARRPAAAHCTGAAITPGPCVSVTSQKTHGDQTGKRSPPARPRLPL